jgi:uncharacterized protein
MDELMDWDNQYKTTMDILRDENPHLAEKFEILCEIIKNCKSGIVAFSGGVDSALLAYLCKQLMDDVLCVTADSPTTPRSELEDARVFVKRYNITSRIISYNELEDERFVKNDEQRCFYCKDGLFKTLEEIRASGKYNCLIDGSNYDDLSDFRPGREAAKKNNVKSPLLEAKLGKEDIRFVSESLGLPTWDKPQMACLSSRFPRDTPITSQDLKRIEDAEVLIKGLGYRDVRVRFHGDMAKIEIGAGEELSFEELRAIVPKIKELGFKYVTLDLEGFRSGSLNE